MMRYTTIVLVLVVFSFLLSVLMAFRNGHAQQPPEPVMLEIITPRHIMAGDSMNIQLSTSLAADTELTIEIFNGFQHLQSKQIVNAGGTGNWTIEANMLTQSGQGVVIVHYGEMQFRDTFKVLPLAAHRMDLLAASNSFRAYGEGTALVMTLASDMWGNPVGEQSIISLSVAYPNTIPAQLNIRTRIGLAFSWIQSAGGPGRVQLTGTIGDTVATVAMNQVPAAPASIDVSVLPPCFSLINFQSIELLAVVFDSHGSPVSDGTLIAFDWANGQGFAPTINGTATLRLAFVKDEPDKYYFTASSGDVISNKASLTIAAEVCNR